MGGVMQDLTDAIGLTNYAEQQDQQAAANAEAKRKAEQARRDAEAKRKRAEAAAKKLREEQKIAKERAASQRAAERSAADTQQRTRNTVANAGKMGMLTFADKNNAGLGQLLATLG